MKILTASQIIDSFIPKERKLVKMPNLKVIDWEKLDFLGWLHPSGHLGYIVCEINGIIRGIVLEKTRALSQKPKLCAICLTMHSGSYVNLFSAKSVKNKNRSIGHYICYDLKCSLYVRGEKAPSASQMMETITKEEKVSRLIKRLEGFIREIYN